MVSLLNCNSEKNNSNFIPFLPGNRTESTTYSEFCKVARYKIHTQKSTGCLCTHNKHIKNEIKNTKPWDFPGSPVVKTPPSNAACEFDACSEKAMAPHSSTLAWKIPWTEEPGGLQSMGSLRVGHDWATSLSLFTFTHWRRKWQPTPVCLPGESQGRGSLVGFRLWGHTESDTTEVT